CIIYHPILRPLIYILFPYTTLFRSQLSQYLPRRHRIAGRRFLDLERHRLAQGQPDAEFQGHALYQRARDADLGGAWRECALHVRSEEHTSELQSRENLVCRLLLEKK